MTVQQLIEREREAMAKAGGSRLGFYIQSKLNLIIQLIEERNYWRRRAEEAEQRSVELNSMYWAASNNESLFIKLLQEHVKDNNQTAH